jgi:hypothetical protein
MNDFLFQMVKSLHVITKGVLQSRDEFFEGVLQFKHFLKGASIDG